MSQGLESVRRGRRLPLFVRAGETGGALPIAFGGSSDPVAVNADTALAKDYVFFNSHEAAFIEAAVDTLIPADHLGPGALELGVATFIDRQLSQSAARANQGPRKKAAGAKVTVSPRAQWTPVALMKTGIADIDAFSRGTRGASFAELGPHQRGVVLAEVECGEAELAIVPNATFFSLLLQLTVEGYLAAPVHNPGKGALPAGRAFRRSPRGTVGQGEKRSDRKAAASAELVQ